MTKQVNVGVIDTSWYADLTHLPILKRRPQARTAAICGRNQGRAEAMARKYDIPQVFTDYQAMIDQAGLEALIMATPDDLHYPVTIAGSVS